MERTAVKSSQIKSIGYDLATQKLEIEFASNEAVYQYEGVQPHIHAALMAAESIGSFFTKNIRGGYQYQRVPALADLLDMIGAMVFTKEQADVIIEAVHSRTK